MIKIENEIVTVEENGKEVSFSISSPEGFKVISDLWIRSGWDNKYVYSFTWLGRPIIQLPEDMIRIQELIYTVQPDVIIETGIAHGGSAIFYASLCKAMNKGRVISVDIEIRPHNYKAIKEHILSEYITLIEGSSIEPEVLSQIKSLIKDNEKVLVFLDSCHTKQHVLEELIKYSELIPVNSYIVAMDGIMEEVVGAPRTQPDWLWNNPRQAALEFVSKNNNFVIDEPDFLFNEGNINEKITYCPSAFIKRIK